MGGGTGVCGEFLIGGGGVQGVFLGGGVWGRGAGGVGGGGGGEGVGGGGRFFMVAFTMREVRPGGGYVGDSKRVAFFK